jgi:hypothetical protein
VLHVRHLTVLGLVTAASSTALAQPSGAQAEVLFRNGQELLAQGKIAEACAAFDASEKLDPGVSTVLNQANCREKNGQLATAWGLFLEAERQTRAATDDAGKQLHQVAADHAQKLEPRLSTLKLSVPADSRVDGLEVRRDNELVDPGAWNQALPIDGGTYTIAARAPGKAEWTTTVTVGAERDAKSVDLAKLPPAAVAGARTTDGAASAAAGARPSSEAHTSTAPLPLVLGGAAIVLAGGAVGFDLWGNSTYDKTKQGTDAERLAAWHSANTKRYVAEGLGVAALGCAGVAVWLYVRDRDALSDDAVARRTVVVPVVTNERAGVALIGRF